MVWGHKVVMLKLILPVNTSGTCGQCHKRNGLKKIFSEKVLVFSCMGPTGSAIKKKKSMNA